MTNLDQSMTAEKNVYCLFGTIRTSWCSNEHDRFLPSLFIHLYSHIHIYKPMKQDSGAQTQVSLAIGDTYDICMGGKLVKQETCVLEARHDTLGSLT